MVSVGADGGAARACIMLSALLHRCHLLDRMRARVASLLAGTRLSNTCSHTFAYTAFSPFAGPFKTTGSLPPCMTCWTYASQPSLPSMRRAAQHQQQQLQQQ